jgi:hypothetical protein
MLSFLGNSKPSETSASSPSASFSLDSSSLPSLSTALVESKTPSSSILSAPYSALSSVAKSATEVAKSASNAAKSVSDAAKSASEAAKSASTSLGEAVTSSSSIVSESSEASSLFSFDFDMWSILRYFGIILILSFLGINLFGYLGKFTENVKETLKPLLVLLGIEAAETVKTTVNIGAAGADVAAKAVTSGVNILEKGISKKDGAKINKIDDHSKIDMNLLNNAVRKQENNTDEPEPDEAGSRTQSSKAKLKSGYCYIGEDRGFRRCIKVGEGDKCMSGDIFPTDEICVNPSLRE